MASPLQEEIINFMFLRRTDGTLDVIACMKLWFGKSNDTDVEIRERFGTHVEAALKGTYNNWVETARGCLALMILIDQFPRNVYRDRVNMFDGDKKARKIVDAKHDWPNVLKPEERIFVPCLILTHQEDVKDQQLCVEEYMKFEALLPSGLHIFRTIFEEHYRIVDLCGCFPHRDHYYGRETTATGRMLMDNPKIRFDLPLIVDDGDIRFGHDAGKLWKATQTSFDFLERIDSFVQDQSRRRSSVISPSWLTPHEVAEYQEAFRKFDKDGSGFLSMDELTDVLKSTGRSYTTSELQKAIDKISGSDKSLGLDFGKFTALLKAQMSVDLKHRMRARFEFFDVDKTGDISLDELSACIRGLDSLVTTAEIEEMMKKSDVNKNGVISYEEFYKMVDMVEEGTEQVVVLRREEEVVEVAKPVAFNTELWDEKDTTTVQITSYDPIVAVSGYLVR